MFRTTMSQRPACRQANRAASMILGVGQHFSYSRRIDEGTQSSLESCGIPAKVTTVLVFGAGAIGAIAGWRLAKNPHVRVSVACRSSFDTTKARGFRISTIKWGTGLFIPYSVHQKLTKSCSRPFDYILVANKVITGDAGLYQSLKEVVDDNTTLVSLQNGLGVEVPLRETFPNNTLISSIIYFSCRQIDPGVIAQEAGIRSYFAGVALYGRRNGKGNVLDSKRLADFVNLGQGDFQILDNFVTERWSKQLWNGAFNPLCAITGLDTRQLLHSPRLSRNAVAKVMKETFDIASAAGVVLDSRLPQSLIEITENSPSIVPSMLQDVRARRPMEIESLCGNIWRLGESLNLDTPMLEELYDKLVHINKGYIRNMDVGNKGTSVI